MGKEAKENENPYAFIGRFDTFRNRIVSDIVLCSPDEGNPNCVRVRAMWDTGCSHSIISRRVADFLRLQSSGARHYRTPLGGSAVCRKSGVRVCVVLGGLHVPLAVGIHDNPNSDPDCDIALGLDFITQGDFSISHSSGALMLSFCYPPVGRATDYTLIAPKFADGLVEVEDVDIIESGEVENHRRELAMMDYWDELAKKDSEK